MGMTDLALATDLTPEQRGYLRTAKDAAKALLELVDDILDLSKIEAGKLALDRVEMNFRETVEDAIKVLALRAGQKGLELAVRLSPALPSIVLGDPGRLRQVVVNLVGNAIKFTDEGEVVLDAEVDAKDDDEVRVRVAVRDTGIGVPEEQLKQIFAPFTQADTSTTRRFGGTGLGLAIATQLVEMMGGNLAVESEVGRGGAPSSSPRASSSRTASPASRSFRPGPSSRVSPCSSWTTTRPTGRSSSRCSRAGECARPRPNPARRRCACCAMPVRRAGPSSSPSRTARCRRWTDSCSRRG
jgi:hypothetical protein